MSFSVSPATPSHLSTLVAVGTSAGHTIAWMQDGVVVKAGSTSNASDITLPSGFFDATDSNSVIDFLIDGVTLSSGVVLGNNLPTVVASAQADAYGVSTGLPKISWTYSDGDGDPQYGYRVIIGSIPSASDIYDTGFVKSTASSVTFPGPAIAAGSQFYYIVFVTDGQKQIPTDPDSTTNRTMVASVLAKGIVNSPPVVSGVHVNGVYGGASMSSATPTVTWLYSDVDGQAQQSFRVVVATDSGLSNRVYDSGTVPGAATSAVYGTIFQSGMPHGPLPAHQLMYVGVQASDTYDASAFSIETFKFSSKPVILVVTVGDGVTTSVNPQNVTSQFPVFTWDYQDADGDGLGAYDIRVADNNLGIGTDGFVGSIWNPGVVTTPESYQVKFDADNKAFQCHMPHQLVVGVTYYFQIRAYDTNGDASDWWVGFFRMNRPPTATNLAVIPASPFKSDDLQATFTFNDDPGDTQSPLTQIRWYQNGVLVASLNDQFLVPHSMTVGGDSWRFTVRPSDGKNFGPLVTSPSVVVVDRPPQAVGLGVMPAQPRTSDDLSAVFAVSDPDGDDVTVSIRWYKNGAEVPALKDSASVPASQTDVGDQWYFTVTPNDGTLDGAVAQSPSVLILNTPPRVIALTLDGKILPFDVSNPNPTIGWKYADDDGQPERAFQVALGTRPLRTRSAGHLADASTPRGQALDGIISTADGTGSIVAGNDVFDSGVIQGSLRTLRYATPDFVPTFTLGATDVVAFNGCIIGADLQTISLAAGANSGSAVFQFPGQQATYEITLTYAMDPSRASSYKLLVDGVVVGQIVGTKGKGTNTYTFPAAPVSAGSAVTVVAAKVDANAPGAFKTLLFMPLEESSLDADQMTLSGYVSTGDGGIKLAGLAGTATTTFSLPSGTYDVELDYVTETAGNPTMSLTIASNVVLSFAFESGAKTRSKFVKAVKINTGDVVKISGARNGGAAARVEKLVFRPSQTVQTGAKLQDGLRYFASVRVFDGTDWSDWATTRFIMKGSAWASSVSNARGWTIEARFSVAQATS